MSEFYDNHSPKLKTHKIITEFIDEKEHPYIRIGVKTRIYYEKTLAAVIYKDYIHNLDRIYYFRQELRDLVENFLDDERNHKTQYDNEITLQEMSEINDALIQFTNSGLKN